MVSDSDHQQAIGPCGSSLGIVLGHDHGLLKLVCALLQELGIEPHKDEPSDAIVETVARLQPSIVVIDIDFAYQELSWAVVRALKEHPSTHDIPVIACAVTPWLLDPQRAFLELNAVRTWSEPFDPIELLRIITLATSEPSAGSVSEMPHGSPSIAPAFGRAG
jgi:CheY-like chemotaxis protein